MDNDDKKKLIQRIRNLPTLPAVFHAIISTIDNPHSSASDLQEKIVNDQSIAAKVLSVANSAYFGYPKTISDITRAIVVLGFDAVKTIALSVSIYKLSPGEPTSGLNKEQFWLHSIGSAHTAKVLAKQMGWRNEEEAFILGLIHDLGKVVLDSYFPTEYVRVIDAVHSRNLRIRDAEEEIIGLDHTDAGAWLGEQWEFPEFLLAGLRWHHRPDDAPAEVAQAAMLTHTADHLVRRIGIGSGGDSLQVPLSQGAPRGLGIPERSIEGVVEQLAKTRGTVEEFFRAMKD